MFLHLFDCFRPKETYRDCIISSVFPPHVTKYLQAMKGFNKSTWQDIAQTHFGVTLMFCDIVEFSKMSHETRPELVMKYLHAFYTLLDNALDSYPNLYKVETIGDCIVVAARLFDNCTEEEGANSMMSYAIEAQAIAKTINMPNTGRGTEVRIGIHTGEVTTGVVGVRMPRFTVFGDTVNTTARLQSSSSPSHIVVSQYTRGLLRDLVDSEQIIVTEFSKKDNLFGIGEVQSHAFQIFRSLDQASRSPSEILKKITGEFSHQFNESRENEF